MAAARKMQGPPASPANLSGAHERSDVSQDPHRRYCHGNANQLRVDTSSRQRF